METLSIFQGISGSEFLHVYLDGLVELQSFRSKVGGVENVVQTVSSLLANHNKRLLGLQLLSKLLDQCSIETFEQKSNLWISSVLKAFNRQELEQYGAIACDVLAKLAEKALLSVDVQKSFAANYLTKSYEMLVTTPASAHSAALRCISRCLRLYPGPSGPSRGIVDKFVTQFIDAHEEDLCENAGKCMLLLLQVRGGGVQGVTHKAQWQDYQMKLLGSVNTVMDEMFAKCTELHETTAAQNQLNVQPLKLSNDPVQRMGQLFIRFRNIINYLKIALREPFPVEKAIAPLQILNVINRGLSVTSVELQRNAVTDNLALSILLPNIHLYLLELLEALMKILNHHLRMYHQYIIELLVDLLKSTSSKNSAGVKKPFTLLRARVWELLSWWCQTLQSGSRCETVAEVLVKELIEDITPYQNEFTLQVLTGARKHMSKKARRQLNKAQNEQSSIAQNYTANNSSVKTNLSEEGNQQLCIAALQFLQDLLMSTSNFLKPITIKITQNKIVKLCGNLHDLPLKRHQLYFNPNCRSELYKSLYVLVSATHSLCPPPTQMIFKLLHKALRQERNLKVRYQCSEILMSLEKIVHPQKEGLLFPLDIRDIRNAFSKFGKEHLLNASEESDEDDTPYADEDMRHENKEEDMENSSDDKGMNLNSSSEKITDIKNSEVTDVIQIESAHQSLSSDTPNVNVEITVTSQVEDSKSLDLNKKESSVMNLEEHSSHQSNEKQKVTDEEDISLMPPKSKIQKLQEENTDTSINDSKTNSLNPDLQADEDLLMADIEAAFVDELN